MERGKHGQERLWGNQSVKGLEEGCESENQRLWSNKRGPGAALGVPRRVGFINRERDCEGAGISVWSSMDSSPRIMTGKDGERSIVNEATKASSKCRRVTKETTFIQSVIYSENQPFRQYLWSAYYLPVVTVFV